MATKRKTPTRSTTPPPVCEKFSRGESCACAYCAVVTYAVWVCVEKENPNVNDGRPGYDGEQEFEDVDLPFGQAVIFNDEPTAREYAEHVQAYASNVRRVTHDTALSQTVMARALQTIAELPANSNSEPDVMGEALDRAQAIAHDALRGHHSTPMQLQVLAQTLYDTADPEGCSRDLIVVGRAELTALMDALTLLDVPPVPASPHH